MALILAVDDDEKTLKVVKDGLYGEGFDVITAANGRDALALLEEHKPDLVLLDIMMPDMDGFRVLEIIRERSDIPVTMLTVKADATSIKRAVDIGADNYLTKPFHIDELAARLRAMLRRSGRRSGTSGSIAPMKALLRDAIREKERKLLRNIMATIEESLVTLDKNLRIKSANRFFYGLFQAEPGDIIGMKISDVLGDRDGKLSAALTGLLGTQDTLENFEFTYQSEKRGERILNITARGIIVAEQQQQQQLLVLQDITERKQAEEEIRREQERAKGYLNIAGVMLAVANVDENITMINKRGSEMLGYKEGELIGKNWFDQQ